MNSDTPPMELIERLQNVISEAWESPGGMCVDAHRCESCKRHWHIMVCPAVRELMGGPQDGEQVYPRFMLNVNKLQRAFDKRPRVYFDSALGTSVPHVIFVGKIAGHKCDVSVMCCPPSNLTPLERVYVDGPKKGMIESVESVEEEDDGPT